jgi:parvulin-like peptidyl-prolyl isomerase
MNLALQTGDSQIPGDRVLQQLNDAQLLPQLLREMVIDETIERVAREYGIDLTPTTTEFDRVNDRVAKILPFQGMNAEQIAAITTRTLKLQKFKQAGWGHKVSTYYQTIHTQLDRVTYSILQVEDPLVAQELFFRIQSREHSFAELASQYSQHETAPNGGLVGPIFIRSLDPAIANLLDRLKPGELSSLIQIDRYYGFIRLNTLTPSQLDEQMHQILLDELFDRWIQTQFAAEFGANAEISLGVAISPALMEQTATMAPALVPVSISSTADNPLPTQKTTPDPFAPDFAARETNLTEDAIDTSLPTTTPEVTVVTEPEQQDLAVTTGFFFPNLHTDRSSPAPTLTAPEPAIDRPTATLDSNPNPFQQAKNRSRLLLGGISIAIALSILAIGANHYFSPSIDRVRPEAATSENRG